MERKYGIACAPKIEGKEDRKGRGYLTVNGDLRNLGKFNQWEVKIREYREVRGTSIERDLENSN